MSFLEGNSGKSDLRHWDDHDTGTKKHSTRGDQHFLHQCGVGDLRSAHFLGGRQFR